MKPQPIAIVIPVYNEKATLAACVRQALAGIGACDARLIVVDDGSTDGAVAALPKDPRVRVIRHGERKGIAAALQAGFAAAPECDVVRLHADVVIETPDWLEKLAEAAQAQPKAGIVGVRLVYPDGRIESEGRSFISGLGFHPRSYALRAFQGEMAGGKRIEVDGVSGALAYYRRELIDRVGPPDAKFALPWMQDDDYCVAARTAGFKVWAEPAIKAVHYTRAAAPTLALANSNSSTVVAPLVATFKQSARKLQAEYWEAKWGWNPYLPDIGEIRRLYGNTELCWQIGEPLRYRPASEQPTVDCCLVTWNTLGLLKRTLESISATNYPMDRIHVVVVNNGSTDGTKEYLEELGRTAAFKLTAVNLSVNTGAQAALNIAFRTGTGDLVAKLDDDIILPPDWINLLTRDLARRPFAACAGLKTVHDDDRRSIQWAMERKYPENFSHDDEADAGQVDYLGRAIHVAGCCCLYRREVFAKCGLLDVRYSPTQWDDIDHGLALTHAGYEVLCDGRLAVVHKKSSNVDRSHAGIANAAGNLHKLEGKWGKDVFEALDTALTASREGRSLPDDDAAGEWLARGPRPEEFPRAAAGLAPDKLELITAIYLNAHAAVDAGSELERLADESLDVARIRQREGQLRVAIDLVLTAINFSPKHVAAYRLLAELFFHGGQTAMARAAARRGLHLAPADGDLKRLVETDAAAAAMSEEEARGRRFTARNHPVPVRKTPGELRVLLAAPYTDRLGAPEVAYVEELRDRLRAAGVEAHLRRTPRPDPRDFDVVHLFAGVQPHETLTQATAIRMLAPDVPLLFSPLANDVKDAAWCGKALARIFTKPAPQRDADYAQYVAGKYELTDETRADRGKIRLPTPDSVLGNRIMESVDRLVVFSEGELAVLRQEFARLPAAEVVPVAADAAELAKATPAEFFAKFGRKEFILVPGRIEAAGNQLMVALALQGANVPLLFTGPAIDPSYASYCRKLAPAGSLFLGDLSDSLQRSAQKAARVTVVASFADPLGRTALTAALAGNSLVLTDRLADKAAYAGNAHFFNPENPGTARQALVAAWSSHGAQAPKREAFMRAFAATRDWSVVIPKLTSVYEKSRGCLAALRAA